MEKLGIKQQLKQFGYNFFSSNILEEEISIPIPSDYRLAPGDEILVYIIGNPRNVPLPPVLKLTVDRDGKIYIPNLGVFFVTGLTSKEVEKIIANAIGINVSVTVGKIRKFPVYVSGEVNRPGRILISATNNLIDTLTYAGGIKKDGSLRNIFVTKRTAKGVKVLKVDLYKLLIEGKPLNLNLEDGDIILVKPIGPVVAIAGDVRRPGIFELSGKEKVKDLLSFAGGLLPSAYKHKIVIQRYKDNEHLEIIEGDLTDKKFLETALKDGDLVIVEKVKDLSFNTVFLKGYIAYKGPYQYRKNLKLSEILKKDILLPNTNLNFAEIKRYNLQTYQLEKIIKFKPIDILTGKRDIVLQPLDEIIFYPKFDFKPIEVTGEVKKPMEIPYREGMTLLEALSGIEFTKDVKLLKAIVYRYKPDEDTDKTDSKDINLLRSLDKKLNANYNKNPKPIKVIYLYKLFNKNYERENIELQPGDKIVVKPIESNEFLEKVLVKGFVFKPGVYPIDEKTTLYDILKAAGGFKPGAYPKGIVVLRKSVARMQKEKLQKAILMLQQTLEKEEAGIMQADLNKEQIQAYRYAFEAKRRLLKEMLRTQVTGRIVGLRIPTNLEALRNSPYNITLEDGDEIYIPRVPSTILVFGEVNNPSALVYRPKLTVKDYIELAGGFTKYADLENIFIIKANGEAISAQTDRSLIEWDSKHKRFIWGWAYNGILDYTLEPGDAIIVPTKVKVPTFWRPLIRDVVQIIYQSALTVYTISHL